MARFTELTNAAFTAAVLQELRTRSEYRVVAEQVRELLLVCEPGHEVRDRLMGTPETVLDASDVLRLLTLEGQARHRVADQPMLDSAAVSALLGSTSVNKRQRAAALRASGEVVALRIGRGFVYPQFQFDLGRRRLHPVVAEVNRALDAGGDPWGVAAWWADEQRTLGAAPQSVVGTGQDDTLREAAQAVRELDF